MNIHINFHFNSIRSTELSTNTATQQYHISLVLKVLVQQEKQRNYLRGGEGDGVSIRSLVMH